MNSVISKTFVSVIIPNYNHSIYLRQRIESILNQTYQNFELIILDDCSTDNSRDIIESYKHNNKITHIIYNETNSGSTFLQWKKGFELAKGEYIWIAESDDYCKSELLEVLMRQIEEQDNIVISYCQSQLVNSNGELIKPILKNRPNEFIDGVSFIKNNMSLSNDIWNASSAIFKRSALENINEQYMLYKAAGDRLFWIEIAKKGCVAKINVPLNYFRQHDNKVSPKKLLDGTLFYEDYQICNLLKEEGYISDIKYFFIRNHYLNFIYKTPGLAAEVQSKAIKLWGINDLILFPKILGIIDNIYIRLVQILNKRHLL